MVGFGLRINERVIKILLLISAVSLFITPVNAQEAMRSLPDCVGSGAEFTVKIDVMDYGDFGMVAETLCDGWTYVGSSLPDYQVTIEGNTVKFILLGETSFTYTVRAPYGDSCCVIDGILKDESRVEYPVEGDNDLCTCDQVPAMSSTGVALLAGFMMVAGVYVIRRNR